MRHTGFNYIIGRHQPPFLLQKNRPLGEARDTTLIQKIFKIYDFGDIFAEYTDKKPLFMRFAELVILLPIIYTHITNNHKRIYNKALGALFFFLIQI